MGLTLNNWGNLGKRAYARFVLLARWVQNAPSLVPRGTGVAFIFLPVLPEEDQYNFRLGK